MPFRIFVGAVALVIIARRLGRAAIKHVDHELGYDDD
jgi:hypothetical protein